MCIEVCKTVSAASLYSNVFCALSSATSSIVGSIRISAAVGDDAEPERYLRPVTSDEITASNSAMARAKFKEFKALTTCWMIRVMTALDSFLRASLTAASIREGEKHLVSKVRASDADLRTLASEESRKEKTTFQQSPSFDEQVSGSEAW